MLDLKPCPFCGIKPVLQHQKEIDKTTGQLKWESWFIRCDGSNCRMWVFIDAYDKNDIDNIMKVWNKRPHE